MSPVTKKQLSKALEAFKRRKKNRTLEEVIELLRSWGFVHRATTKEGGGLWRRGSCTVTLPKPHGRDKVLAPRYVTIVINEIERAELEEPLEIN